MSQRGKSRCEVAEIVALSVNGGLTEFEQQLVIKAFSELARNEASTSIDWSTACRMCNVEFSRFMRTRSDRSQYEFDEACRYAETEVEEIALGKIRKEAVSGDISAAKTLLALKRPPFILNNQTNNFGTDAIQIGMQKRLAAEQKRQANGLAQVSDQHVDDALKALTEG